MSQIENQVMENVCQIFIVEVNYWLGQTTCLTDLMSKQVIEDIPDGGSR